MKKRELIRRWGIMFLSFIIMSGTASVPSYAVYANEAENFGTDVEVAPEPEPEPDPDPEPPTVVDNGGTGDSGGDSGNTGDDGNTEGSGNTGDNGNTGDDGNTGGDGNTGDDGNSGDNGDNSGTGGGGSPAQSDDDENGDDNGDGNGTGATNDNGGGSTAGGYTGNTSEGYTSNEIAAEDPEASEHSSTGKTAASKGNTGATSKAADVIVPTKVGEMDQPEGYKEAEEHNGTNEELIAQQHIVTDLPEIRKDFRFTTVDKVYAFSTHETDIYEEQNSDSRVVGTIAANGILYELENEDNGWIYVESGEARGFVREDDLIRGEEAEELMERLEKQAARISAMLPEGISKETYFFTAQDTVPYYENEAYAFRRITTRDVVIKAEAAIAKSDTGIMEERSEDARTVGSLKEGDLVYVIEEADDGWLFVESGDVRGFIPSGELDRSGSAQAQIDEEGESSFSTAKEVITPKENKAIYYSLNSVKEGAKYNEIREKILEKALSCVGNPYVWGGTSLTNGADCSGFVQTLYGLFGYKLPRVAAAQSRVGTQIPVSDAAPGDLIFFARNGYVFHVAMYAGDGKTVEAYSSQYGIITKEVGGSAVWATRIIED